MPTLMIVDDEPLITDDLCDAFREGDFGDLRVLKAYSAMEAARVLEHEAVDVLLLDIAMPGMTGLELQEIASTRWSRCRVIFLSGYSRFDYVQQAIHNKGFDYILKSEGDERIFDAVRRALREVEQESIENHEAVQSESLKQQSVGVLRQSYLQRLVKGDPEPIRKDMNLEQIGIPLRPEQEVYLMVGYLKAGEGGARDRVTRLVPTIIATVCEVLASAMVSVGFRVGPEEVAWLVQDEDDPVFSFGERTRGAFESAARRIRHEVAVSIRFVGYDFAMAWDDIHKYVRFLELTDATPPKDDHVLFLSRDAIDRIPAASVERSLPLLSEFKALNLMELYLERGDHDSFFRLFRDVRARVESRSDTHLQLTQGVYFSLVTFVLSFVRRWSLYDQVAETVDIGALTDFGADTDVCTFLDSLEQLISIVFDNLRENPQIAAHNAVVRIKRHIDSHLGEDLSLTRLSDLTHLNSSYLSRLFRQNTGTTISGYVAERRLLVAEEMLLRDVCAVSEIAAAVGFWTASSFTKFFNRHRGMSPSAFRERYRQ